LTDFHHRLTWAVRILPFLIIAGLLIPGDAWIAQEIRTFAGLITVLVLTGHAPVMRWREVMQIADFE